MIFAARDILLRCARLKLQWRLIMRLVVLAAAFHQRGQLFRCCAGAGHYQVGPAAGLLTAWLAPLLARSQKTPQRGVRGLYPHHVRFFLADGAIRRVNGPSKQRL